MRLKNFYYSLQLIFLSVVLSFIVIEILARLFLVYLATPEQFLKYASYDQLKARYHLARFTAHQYLGYVTTPNYQWDNNKHNSLGFRGDEVILPKPASSYRIVCLGGSTTYGDGVQDYTQSYPVLLQKYLHDRGLTHIEVINAGVPGYTSLESLINLQTRILDLEPDLIIDYDGSNDFPARLVWPPGAYRGDYAGFRTRPPFFEKPALLESSTALRSLMVAQGFIEPHSSIARIFTSPATAYASLFNLQKRDNTYPAGIFREVSAETMLLTNKPVYFERNLTSIIAIARAYNIEVMLATFAYSPFFPGEVTTYPEYQQAIKEHNKVIKELAQTTGTYFFDFAGLMPAEKGYYTDGIHLNEAGNTLQARLFGDFILDKVLTGTTKK